MYPDYCAQSKVKARLFNRVWIIDRAEVERMEALQGKGRTIAQAQENR
jgi:hypothetical protein